MKLLFEFGKLTSCVSVVAGNGKFLLCKEMSAAEGHILLNDFTADKNYLVTPQQDTGDYEVEELLTPQLEPVTKIH